MSDGAIGFFAFSPSDQLVVSLLDYSTQHTERTMTSTPQSAGRERTIASGDVEIAATEFPNPGRPPVVLLHGIGSRGQSWWPALDPLDLQNGETRIMGHSLGGLVALYWASAHSPRAAALVVEDPSLRVTP